ncbi:MAG: zinc-dependent alcohol dehydrogenase family protein [Nitrospirae bacterium]|nr:zinc-dependent alcohol dehydrogenase family protein [Nitrospirota bacterium]
MRAMVMKEITDLRKNKNPLMRVDLPVPEPVGNEVLLRVLTCGVCHTDIDEIEGRTPPLRLPVVPGHQVVGIVEQMGPEAHLFKKGDRAGIAWINSACGSCHFCRNGEENLCDRFVATGRDAHGGYAEYAVVHEKFAYPIPDLFSDAEAAPLLCAGAIGYRSLRLTDMHSGDTLGLVGFGASGHIVLKLAAYLYPGSRVYVFSRTEAERIFAMELGAAWAGNFDDACPERLRCAIDTTPAWGPIVSVLRNLEEGGRLVINAIRKEEADKEALLSIDYAADLWMEKEIKSVANITRRDVEEFLRMAAAAGIRPEVQEYPLEDANRALLELKERKIRGAKVLRVAS